MNSLKFIKFFANHVNRLLLNNEINKPDRYGRNSLQYAILAHNYELVDWLLKSKANTNQMDYLGFIPKDYAAILVIQKEREFPVFEGTPDW